jgi:hypothetical protein
MGLRLMRIVTRSTKTNHRIRPVVLSRLLSQMFRPSTRHRLNEVIRAIQIDKELLPLGIATGAVVVGFGAID